MLMMLGDDTIMLELLAYDNGQEPPGMERFGGDLC